MMLSNASVRACLLGIAGAVSATLIISACSSGTSSTPSPSNNSSGNSGSGSGNTDTETGSAQQAPALQTPPAQALVPSTFPKAAAAADADRVVADTLASGLVNPWGMAVLPDGRFLVTERPGRLRLISADGKTMFSVSGVPEVYSTGQGGLLDVVLDPEFVSNPTLYFSFAEPGDKATDMAGTAVAKAVLSLSADAGNLSQVQVIYRQIPKLAGGAHFGSRVVPAKDGTLFITQGDRGQMQMAQDLNVLQGKVVRINKDGSIPANNPFVGRSDARPEIWSYGHRNMQGASLDANGKLWTIEHGAKGGDEVNQPEAGKNYGWPVITYGVNYDGNKIGTGTSSNGMEQPVHYFDPSIAPSGLLFYSGDAFPAWKGNMLMGALAGSHLAHLKMKDGRVIAEERYLLNLGERIRDIRQGPLGQVYLLTDSANGRLLRLRLQ